VAAALHWLLGNALPGQRYNIVGEELTNLSIAELVAATVDEPLKAEIVDFHSERPGHDLRYALDGSRLRGLGWEYPKSLGDSLAQTVLWSVAHPKWLVK
jgi:dTDP-glucose 4,6-dehydratase